MAANDDNNAMRFCRSFLLLLLAVLCLPSALNALEKQPASVYHARRVALAAHIQGGAAVLFAAYEPPMEYMDYRQDEDFFYLTGWNEPGAALLVTGEGANYKETLFLPTRNLRAEKYTGVKLDAATPGAALTAGVDSVAPMTDLATVLNRMIEHDRAMLHKLWAEPSNQSTVALIGYTSGTLGLDLSPVLHDVSAPIQALRLIKDASEVGLLRKASDASIAAQVAMMRATKPGITERTLAGKMTAAWLENGCERASYPPIVGSGINSTILHYAENSRTLENGDVLLVDAACEYSMYASDITRTVPVNGHFTDRQREIYNVVLGAQQAAIQAFVLGKSKINDRDRKDPNSLDTAAYNYINTHGKSLDGQPLGKYWLHGLGHMVGIDVHDPGDYPAVLKPGMVFTIEPGVYIPEEKLGVRIECVFLVGEDGKLIDLVGNLPHTAEDVEALMKSK